MDIRKGCRDKTNDTSEQVILRHPIVEPELIEQACLIAQPPTHHRSLQGSDHGITGNIVRQSSQAFFDSIGPLRHLARHNEMSAVEVTAEVVQTWRDVAV